MLSYPIYSRQPNTRMFVVAGSKSGSTITITTGGDFFSSIVSGGTGVITFTLKEPSKKVVVADGSATGAAKRLFVGLASTTGFTATMTPSSLGSAVDGGFCIVGFVSYIDMTESYAPVTITGAHPKMRCIFGKVTTDTSAPYVSQNTGASMDGLNGEYSVSAASPAAFTVTYGQDFQRVGAVLVIPGNSTVTGINISQTATGFTATMTNISDAAIAVGATYSFMAVGFDSNADISTSYSEVISNLRNARLETFLYNQATQVASVNTPSYTVSTNATGSTNIAQSSDSILGISDCGVAPGSNLPSSGEAFPFATLHADATNWFRLDNSLCRLINNASNNIPHSVIIFQQKGFR